MIVTLDGRKLDFAPDAEAGLPGLVDRLRAAHLDGRLLTAIAINGRTLTENDLSNGLDVALAPADQIDFESGVAGELVATALRNVAEELGHCGPRCEAIAQALNTGRTPEAMRDLAGVINAWQGCERAVTEGAALLQRDLTVEAFEGRAIDEHLRELAEKLREVRDALDARDMVFLADLAHYELPPICESWGRLLDELARTIA